METYGLTSKGPNIKSTATIIKEMAEDIGNDLGITINTKSQTVLNLLITNFADKIRELWEFGEDVYYSQYPSTATGVNLDNVCQLAGILREQGRPSYHYVNCVGIDGTVVDNSTIISTTTNPAVQLKCSNNTDINRTIRRANCNFIALEVVSVYASHRYRIEFKIDGELYYAEYNSLSTDSTEHSIITGLEEKMKQNDLTKISIGTAESDDGKLYLTIETTNPWDSMDFTDGIPMSLNPAYISTMIKFETMDNGNFPLEKGTVSKIIYSNSNGLKGVSNQTEIYTEGNYSETDEELRESYAKKIYNRSSMTIYSIQSALLDKVDDVVSVKVKENNESSPLYFYKNSDIGYRVEQNTLGNQVIKMPPHSIFVVVDTKTLTDSNATSSEISSIEEQIARVIFENKPAGIQTVSTPSNEGGKTVYYNNKYNGVTETITVNFSIPTNKDVYFYITDLTLSSGFARDTNFENELKLFIKNYVNNLELGTDIKCSKLEYAIFKEFPYIETINVFVNDTNDFTSTSQLLNKRKLVISDWDKPTYADTNIAQSQT